MTITSSYSLFYYYVFPLILTNSLSLSLIMNLGHVLKFHLELKAQCHYGFFWNFLFERMIKVKVN